MGLFQDFINLFYPPLCGACERVLQKEEAYICLHCRHELPRTHFHRQKDNPIEKIFWGRFPINAGSAYFYFQKGGKVQTLMHNIKYRGLKEAAEEVGHWFGTDLLDDGRFTTVDYIVPVPLHRSKLKSRGYNQSEWLGRGLAAAMKKPLSTDNLIRTVKSDTQTKKSRIKRWENVAEIFSLARPEEFSAKHILLIDDVVTTGATLESCAQTIIQHAPQVRVSIATLAIATH